MTKITYQAVVCLLLHMYLSSFSKLGSPLVALFSFFAQPYISVSIAFFRGVIILLNGPGCSEGERNFIGSLPASPVLQYGIGLLSAKVMDLLKSKILGQILSLNIVELVLSEFTPGDSSLSLTDGHF